MKVYGLVGKSGTGKSFQAMSLCREKNIECIIDDGLFIRRSKILAGKSAKRQSTKMGAVKTAIFTDEEHRREVADKIKSVNPKSILVLGTSERMINMIADAVRLPEVGEMIDIEDITTQEDRETAKKSREEMGKHVIPVPALQLKREFAGYFIYPLKIFRGWGRGQELEKTVVRPTYSYLGEYTFSDRAISDIVFYVGKELPEISAVLKSGTEKRGQGIIIHVAVTVGKGEDIIRSAKKLQETVIERVEYMTAFNVDRVNVEVRGIK